MSIMGHVLRNEAGLGQGRWGGGGGGSVGNNLEDLKCHAKKLRYDPENAANKWKYLRGK